jgi:hypothetical protein
MAELKKLKLIQLERGIALGDRLNIEEGIATQMVAAYLAQPGTLVKAKANPGVMDDLLEKAAELDGEEAQEILADFLSQCTRYVSGILGSLPKVTEEIKAKVLAAQSGLSHASSPTS